MLSYLQYLSEYFGPMRLFGFYFIPCGIGGLDGFLIDDGGHAAAHPLVAGEEVWRTGGQG